MSIKNRGIVMAVVLSFVTCGIYGIYWAWCMAKEATSVNDEDSVGKALLMIFLPFIGLYMVEKSFAEGCAKKGIEHKDNAILYLIICLIPYGWLVSYCMLQNELNKLATE